METSEAIPVETPASVQEIRDVRQPYSDETLGTLLEQYAETARKNFGSGAKAQVFTMKFYGPSNPERRSRAIQIATDTLNTLCVGFRRTITLRTPVMRDATQAVVEEGIHLDPNDPISDMSLLIDDTTSHVTDPTTDKEPLPKQKTPKVPEKNTVGAASDAALNTLNTMREKRRAAKRAGQKQ